MCVCVCVCVNNGKESENMGEKIGKQGNPKGSI